MRQRAASVVAAKQLLPAGADRCHLVLLVPWFVRTRFAPVEAIVTFAAR